MTNPVPLEWGQYYHICNRGHNRENLFVEERNYLHFLRLYAAHVEPIASTFAYCLLPNHFHFLVKTPDLAGLGDLPGLKKPSQYFSNLFNAYARAFNKAYDRSGALFEGPFGRKLITSNAYFVWLIAYIHQNPQKHGIVSDFRNWPFSSYHAHLSQLPTRLKRDAVLAWFEGEAGFMASHERWVNRPQVAALVPEDFG